MYDNYFFPILIKRGRNKKVAINDTISPPIVPAARGNQNPSLYSPIKKGMNPKIVDITVKNTGLILAFHAFRYALSGWILYFLRILLYSSKI